MARLRELEHRLAQAEQELEEGSHEDARMRALEEHIVI